MWLLHSVVLMELTNDFEFTARSTAKAKAIIIIPINSHKSMALSNWRLCFRTILAFHSGSMQEALLAFARGANCKD